MPFLVDSYLRYIFFTVGARFFNESMARLGRHQNKDSNLYVS